VPDHERIERLRHVTPQISGVDFVFDHLYVKDAPVKRW
jgi:hypothetical protein